MTSDEIRDSFLGFFKSKGHAIIPSSSLIPHGDPTLLLTTAGMVQFKPYFLGQEIPPNPKLATCQKCFRTTDIDSVGDPTHLTFFEMLGNFSIGDYFKKEAIAWAWEYVTNQLNLPANKLWITIFLDDDEAFRIWRDTGVPEDRIIRLGEKTNFWGPAGDSGPCGPCSEIHYDLGPEAECTTEKCEPGCDCGRYVEIWNLVFTQYNQDSDGKRTRLPRPNIDTGMGLERLTAIMQKKVSVYETTIFTPLLQQIGRLCGLKYGADVNADLAMRVVAEHSRGVTFLIGDGVSPSNEGRGYVLRRLLRRAVLFGRKLGLEKAFLAEIAAVAVKQMGHVYPELKKREATILKTIEMEEARFSETLNVGLELLGKVMDEASGKKSQELSGAVAFKLYDTYGFPVDLTAVVAKERGFSVDMIGFEAEMEKQRERARASQKFEKAAESGVGRSLDTKATDFTGYTTVKEDTAIIAILVKETMVGEVGLEDEAGIVLQSTPFYGEMGGQVGDTGEIRGSHGRFLVTDTVRRHDEIVHRGKVVEGVLRVGEKVTAAVDEERRRDIARNHTATHLLHMALRKVIGEYVEQRGSLVAPERFTFDFSHLTLLTPEELQRVQRLVNDAVRRNLVVNAEEMPYQEAVKQGVIALFGEKYGEKVRVLRVGKPPVSAELCGGTHVSATGEIGLFYILNEHSVGAGLRRIEGVTGRHAEAAMEKMASDLRFIAQAVGASLDNVTGKVAGKIAELEVECRRAEEYEKALAKIETGSLASRFEIINGVNVLAVKVSARHPDVLRTMCDLLREKSGSGVIVLGTVYENKPAFVAAVTPDLAARGFDAGKIVREVAKVTGGGGGGKPTLAQGSGKDKSQLDAALQSVRKLVQTAQ